MQPSALLRALYRMVKKVKDTIAKKKYTDPIKYPILLAVPALLVYVIFFIYPALSGFYYALTTWSAKSVDYKFVGFQQIIEVINNPVIATALKNSFIFAGLTMLIENVLGLSLAIALNQKIKSRTFLRAVYFAPAILSVVACGLTFKGIMHPTTGLFNGVLNSIGLGSLANGWYTDKVMAIYSAVLMDVWRAMGVNMAIYLAGLQSISQDYYEAATLDGAHGWGMFTKITLPLISNTITVNVVLTIIGGLRIFDVVYYFTNGGPGNASQVMQTMAYQYMGKGIWGYSSAISSILTVIVLAVSVPLLLMLRRNDERRTG